jgi:predicted acyltransferase (DUF342 family)
MANTVSIISLNNDFGDWFVQTNALAVENNNLAANAYTKATGTLFLNEPTLGLQVANSSVFGGPMQVVGVGSYVTIQNSLNVGGQSTFTYSGSGPAITISGQANVNGKLFSTDFAVSNSAFIGNLLTVANNATVSNNLTITGNTTTGYLSSLGNSSFGNNLTILNNTTSGSLTTVNDIGVGGSATILNSVTTNRIQANSSINTSTFTANNSSTGTLFVSADAGVSGNTTIAKKLITNIIQANTSVNTTNITASSISTNLLSVSGSGSINSSQINTGLLTVTIGSTTPTVDTATSNTQIATTQFVNNLLTSGLTNSYFNSVGIGTAASGTAGEIRATNAITSYYSDERLKTKLGNIESALDKLMTLNGFYYEANEIAQELGYEVKKEVGLSAQEVQKVLPEVVTNAPINDKYLTIHYERIIPLIIEAIKELKNEISK